MHLDALPGYAEAVSAALATERTRRDLAFLDLPPDPIGGVAVRALTLRDYLTLSAAGSPFVVGGSVPDREDATVFLWALSPDFCGRPAARRRFATRLAPVSEADLFAGIRALVADAMDDAPRGSADGPAPVVSLAATILHTFRTAYPGTTREEVLGMRCDVLWQLWRCVQRERNPKATFTNRQSDRVKRQFAARAAEVPATNPE